MKNLTFFCFLFLFIGFVSCKDNKKEAIAPVETSLNIECYTALYEKDTLDLKISTLKDGEIKGTLEMLLFEKAKKVGEIAGEFRGDTLFASYTFTAGTNTDVTYKNPMAFLKRGNELILGKGEIENYMGASYFVKGKPIDFDQVKYKFTKVDCGSN